MPLDNQITARIDPTRMLLWRIADYTTILIIRLTLYFEVTSLSRFFVYQLTGNSTPDSDYTNATISSQAAAHLRQASAHALQCSMPIAACFSHSSAQALHTSMQPLQ